MKLHLVPHAPKGNIHVGHLKLSKKAIAIGGGSIVILAITIVILYYKYPPFKSALDNLLGKASAPGSAATGGGDPSKSIPVAPKVAFDVIPDVVKPNAYYSISGKFLDDSNSEVQVNEGFFYVFKKASAANPDQKQIVMQGSLGQNISNFNRMVMTPGFADGEYEVTVSDQPLSDRQIGNLHAGAGPYGSGLESMTNPQATPGVNEIQGIATP